MPFFNNLQKHEMPPSMLRMEHCMVQTPDKVGIFFIPGPCHIQKNLASQLRSSGCTIKFGHLHVDFAAAVDLGLPGPGNFCMRDSVYTYTIYIYIYVYTCSVRRCRFVSGPAFMNTAPMSDAQAAQLRLDCYWT